MKGPPWKSRSLYVPLRCEDNTHPKNGCFSSDTRGVVAFADPYVLLDLLSDNADAATLRVAGSVEVRAVLFAGKSSLVV